MQIQTVQTITNPDNSTSYIVNGVFTAVQGDVSPVWPTAWNDVQAWFAEGNTATPYVPPAPMPPDPKVVAQQTLQTLIPQIINTIMVGPSAPLQFAAQWLAAWKAAGNG